MDNLQEYQDGSNTLYINTNDTIYIGCTNGVQSMMVTFKMFVSTKE